MKRIAALLLAVLTLFSLASCSTAKKDGDYAFVAGDTKLSSSVFYSELLGYKNDFLINYLGLSEDNPDIWAQDSPAGRLESVGDTIVRMAVEDMVQFAWVIEYAKDNGLAIGEEDKKLVDEGIENMKGNFETEEEYKEYLTTLTFDEETIRDYLELTLLYDKGFQLLTGENGLYPIAEADYDNYYAENFYTVKHIFINNVSKEDAEGNVIDLTDEEKLAKKEKADKVVSDLDSGTSFDSLYLLSEDSMSSLYPDGITFTEGMIDPAYEEAVKKLEIGKYTMIEGTNGGLYIIYRAPLSETDRADYESLIIGAVQSDVQTNIYNDRKNEVTVNYDIINSFDISDIPIFTQQ